MITILQRYEYIKLIKPGQTQRSTAIPKELNIHILEDKTRRSTHYKPRLGAWAFYFSAVQSNDMVDKEMTCYKPTLKVYNQPRDYHFASLLST